MSSQAHPQAAPTAKQPHGPTNHQYDITLTTRLTGKTITVVGEGKRHVPVDQDETRFHFTLDDDTGAHVKFQSLDAADHLSDCPPVGSGNRSQQIFDVTIDNDGSKRRPNSAGFTDRNDHPAHKGTMNVSYQWNFTCDEGYTVRPFDPIISNGGKSGRV